MRYNIARYFRRRIINLRGPQSQSSVIFWSHTKMGLCLTFLFMTFFGIDVIRTFHTVISESTTKLLSIIISVNTFDVGMLLVKPEQNKMLFLYKRSSFISQIISN